MLSHENVVAGVCAVILQLGDHRPTSSDIMISFLPLAHMLERCCEVRNFKYILADFNYSKCNTVTSVLN